MKIAYFTDTYIPEINGVTNTLKKLSEYLDGKAIEYAFFAPGYDDKMIVEEKNIYRYKGFRTNISPESCLAFPNTKEIFTQCDRLKPDLVHVTTEFGIGYKGMKYALSRKLPFVKSYHTNYDQYLKYFNLEIFEAVIQRYLKWFHRFADITLAPSKNTLERLKSNGYKNLDIWSRGIDTGRFSPSRRSLALRDEFGIRDRTAFLYVGRLSPEKGLHILTEAIQTINSKYKDKAVFIFTGDGPYAQTIRDAGLGNVILTGFKTGDELSEIYASCDCFVFPSGTETFGNSALEAMASGLPVVSVNSGGVTEFLVHGYNSLLAENNDAQVFTEHMIRLMEDRELRDTISKNALITAKERNWNDIFDGLLAKYEKLIRGKAEINEYLKAS